MGSGLGFCANGIDNHRYGEHVGKSLRARRRKARKAIAAVVRAAVDEAPPALFWSAFASERLADREAVELSELSSRSVERLTGKAYIATSTDLSLCRDREVKR